MSERIFRKCKLGLWSDLNPEPSGFSCIYSKDYPNCEGCPNLIKGKIVWEDEQEKER